VEHDSLDCIQMRFPEATSPSQPEQWQERCPGSFASASARLGHSCRPLWVCRRGRRHRNRPGRSGMRTAVVGYLWREELSEFFPGGQTFIFVARTDCDA
jgi:hypothetical protein